MIKIGNKVIGEKPYIIAEAGMNHNGSMELAKQLIVEAAKAGADAIKFQTYTADELVVKGTPRFWEHEGDEGKDQHQAYLDLKKIDNYPELIKCCEENNIEFLSTPFSIESADYLNSLGMKAFKIASSDMSTLPFLKHIAKFGKPILLSTGASTMDEIYESVTTILSAGNSQIILLHCSLCYPTKPEDANLNMIRTLSENVIVGLPVGVSDHTIGIGPAIAAMAMGAKVIEKHFTIDKTLLGNADHWLSVNPTELAEIVKASKEVYVLGGSSVKKVFDNELETRKYDKRSWVSRVEIKKGEPITEDLLTWKRPGTGIWPNEIDWLREGHVALVDIPADTTITWDMVDVMYGNQIPR